jgi:DNA-binding CsgD family transcriptional regulator
MSQAPLPASHTAGSRESDRRAQPSPTDSLVGRRTACLARHTASEWLAALPGPVSPNPAVPSAAEPGRLPSGITAKFLFHDSICSDERRVTNAERISTSGADVRVTSAEIPAVVISDRRTALIISGSSQNPGESIWTRQPSIIAALAALFEQTWNAASPIQPRCPEVIRERTSDLSWRQRELLRLLASGATDEVAARHLGLSVRTTRRHMASLMDSLQATSRFQAGAEAARRGWLA